MRISTLAIAAALAFTGCVSATPEPGFSPMRSAAPVKRFARLDDGYYRGGDPEGSFNFLKSLGVRTIVNLRRERDYRASAEAAGFNYVYIPMTPREPPGDEQVALFLSVVENPAMRPVYVHCHGGKHRTSAMSAVYRVEAHHWPVTKALREMKYFGLTGERFKSLYKWVADYWRHAARAAAE